MENDEVPEVYHPLPQIESNKLKPGDKVKVELDVGERFVRVKDIGPDGFWDANDMYFTYSEVIEYL